MKRTPHQTLPLLLAASLTSATLANAQTYIDDNAPLVVNSSNSPFSEQYVNRTTESSVYYTINIASGYSYTGRNVNISNHSSKNGGTGIYVGGAINLSADPGTYNTINVGGRSAHGIRFGASTQTSHISRTIINNSGNGGYGINTSGSSTKVVLDDVIINISDTAENDYIGWGIFADSGSTVTNSGKGQVTVTALETENAGSAFTAKGSGTLIDLYRTTIDFSRATTTSDAVVYTLDGGTLSLTDSTIKSRSGNVLAYAFNNSLTNGSSNTMSFNNVNLDQAKNQAILNFVRSDEGGSTSFNFSNGTHFDGYAGLHDNIGDNDAATHIRFDADSSWHVTAHSWLGSQGTLSLDGTCALDFDCNGNDFYSINGAAVMLAAGTLITIDTTGYSGGEQTFDLLNFIDMSAIEPGVLVNLIPHDSKYIWDVSDLLIGGTISVALRGAIPEPATTTLGLVSLCILAIRRRKILP